MSAAGPDTDAPPPPDPDVLIVGGGLAGLRAARTLDAAGVDWALVEAGDALGGRVRTDHVEGFALDRGFQVLLTAYPEARRALDLDALDLHAFSPGALVRADGAFHAVADPLRRPRAAWSTLRAPVGTLADKARLLQLRRQVRRTEPLATPEQTTVADLEATGFSPQMIARFLRPLLAGILLDPTLSTSNRMARFVLQMQFRGEVALPAGGMQALPDQLAAALTRERVYLRTRVDALEGTTAHLRTGARVNARRAVVVATEGPEAARLLDGAVADPGSRSVACCYFAAETPPLGEPALVLNGEGRGPVTNLSELSAVAPGYAPDGAALVSAAIVDDRGLEEADLVAAVREQLLGWFGARVRAWRHLATYRIAHAQPAQPVGWLSPPHRPVRLGAGRYVAGDHRDVASINGALASGRRAADAVLADLP